MKYTHPKNANQFKILLKDGYLKIKANKFHNAVSKIAPCLVAISPHTIVILTLEMRYYPYDCFILVFLLSKTMNLDYLNLLTCHEQWDTRCVAV